MLEEVDEFPHRVGRYVGARDPPRSEVRDVMVVAGADADKRLDPEPADPKVLGRLLTGEGPRGVGRRTFESAKVRQGDAVEEVTTTNADRSQVDVSDPFDGIGGAFGLGAFLAVVGLVLSIWWGRWYLKSVGGLLLPPSVFLVQTLRVNAGANEQRRRHIERNRETIEAI